MASLVARARLCARRSGAAKAFAGQRICDVLANAGSTFNENISIVTLGALQPKEFDSTLTGNSQRFFATTTAQSETAESDFFGEPVTFFESDSGTMEAVPTIMASLDDLLLCIVSRGKSSSGGGDDFGISTQAAHSSAITWARVIQYAFQYHKACPMLSYVAVGPLVAQTGVAYVRVLDKLLASTNSPAEDTQQHVPVVRLLQMAKEAASQKSNSNLSPRERWHLEALDSMLQQNHRGALEVMLRLLRHCPGDALALSLAMDLSNTVGNAQAAMRAATTVSSYWHERGVRRKAIPGYSIGASWIALGLAVGGRFAEAECLADQAMQQDKAGCGGVATYALTHAYDAEGRTSEAISLLVGFDGVEQYQSSGWLFFDAHLGGYGARFSLDREGTTGGKVALRVYDNCFERILQYSGFASGDPWSRPRPRAPTRRRDRVVKSVEKGTQSLFQQMFGGESTLRQPNGNETAKLKDSPDADKQVSVEEVLAWLPPTPKILTDATLLLLRLTMNGTVAPTDARWRNLRNAWDSMGDLQREHTLGAPSLDFYPLASLVANLLASEHNVGEYERSTGHVSNLGAALRLMGDLLKVRESPVDDDVLKSDVVDNDESVQWAKVVQLFAGSYSSALEEFDAWEIDARPILEHAICYAASLSNDHDALCTARAICSKGVCLRPNSPEEWWRYSVILDQLGDEVAAEDARAASVSRGSGEGSSL